MDNLPKYVINLERDKHKLIRFDKPMTEQNINYEIWRGSIVAKSSDLEKFHKEFEFTRGTRSVNYPGNVGSAFAHLSLWNYCLEQPYEYFIIFEDNCIVKKMFKHNIDYYLKKIKKFDFLNLNVIRPSGQTNDNILFKYKKLEKLPFPPPNTWMSSYIVSKKMICFLVGMSKNINYDFVPIDKIIMGLINKFKYINYYSLNTNYLTTHTELHSDTRKVLNRKQELKIESYIATEPIKQY